MEIFYGYTKEEAYGKKLEDKDLERAIKLSQEKYCPVTAMLKKAVDITYSYQVVDSS